AHQAIRCGESGALHSVVELGGEAAQHPHLAVALPQSGASRNLARTQRPRRNERVPNGGHAADPCRFNQRAENLREDVRVLVGIEMGDLYTGRLNLSNLRNDLTHQLIWIETSKHGPRGHGRDPGIKSTWLSGTI